MTSNHKLTSILQGRTIAGTGNSGGTMTINFDDDSSMTVQTAPSGSNRAATGGKVSKVRQAGTELALDLEGGATFEITLAEETSSVMVRDKNHTLEYAD